MKGKLIKMHVCWQVCGLTVDSGRTTGDC